MSMLSGHQKMVALLLGSVVFLAIGLSFVFSTPAFTGLAIQSNLNIDPATEGLPITGVYRYDLAALGPLPLDSTIKMYVNGYVNSNPLVELLSPGVELNYLDKVVIYPTINVDVSIDTLSDSFPLPPSRIETIQISSTTDGVLPLALNEEARVIDAYTLNGAGIPLTLVSLTGGSPSATLTTTYSETVKGFQYPTLSYIDINLNSFNFIAPAIQATIQTTVSYKGEQLASNTQVISVIDPSAPSFSPSSDSDSVLTSDDSSLKPTKVTPITDEAEKVKHLTVENDIEHITAELTPIACKNFICSEFGPCAVAPLDLVSSSDRESVFRQARSCKYTDCGEVFTDTRTCSSPKEVIDVVEADVPHFSPADFVPSQLTISSSEIVNWEKTISYTDRDLVSQHTFSAIVEPLTRLHLKVAGSTFYLGLVSFDSDSAQIEWSSSTYDLSFGSLQRFDSDGDGSADISLTLIPEGNSVRFAIESLIVDGSALIATDHDRVLTLVNREVNQPVAHVIFNEQSSSLGVFLVQSASSYPSHCYNTVQDDYEGGVDCGDGCTQCKIEQANVPFIVSWAVVFSFLLLLFFLVRRV